jgi:hypothetical protein
MVVIDGVLQNQDEALRALLREGVMDHPEAAALWASWTERISN